MKDTLILKDGSSIELEAGASLSTLQVLSESREKMIETWKKLTTENLAEARVQNGSGLTVGTYMDLILVSETSVVKENEAVLTTYNIREKTEEEKRLEAVEKGLSILAGEEG